jgi:4-diphosphocytidyl-2-C-methyl-D-erythritol kinase
MKKVSAKSYTRLTMALDIIGKIKDGPYNGFHELNTIKHLISLHDVVTVEESHDMRLICNEAAVPCDSSNTCWKICTLLKEKCNINANVTITIDKHIPVKGGLAGGSANAATTLELLCELWNLNIDTKEKADLSRAVGQDVPFYFYGPTAFDTEAGGTLEPIETSLTFDMICVIPDFGVSTKEAYGNIDYSLIATHTAQTQAMKKAFLQNDRTGVVSAVHNDFECSVFASHPQLSYIKKQLIASGCIAAALSGSGSTMIGILESAKDFEQIKNAIDYPSILVSSVKR